MKKTYRPWAPDQSLLFPPSPREWLPSGHLAYLLLDIVDSALDLSRIYAYYERESRGFPPHHPQMMLTLLFYGYCTGVRSSRAIERKTYDDVAFRVIANGSHPDHSCICDFRNRHAEAIEDLFLQVTRVAKGLGMVALDHVSLDGSKIRANASKHKAMSYGRMKQDEERLRKEIREILAEAQATDQAEDEEERRGGGTGLPEELRRREERLARILEVKGQLEEEARSGAEASPATGAEPVTEESSGSDEEAPPALPRHRIPTTKDGIPTDKAQRNFTDPESRIQKTNTEGFIQGYNTQIAVDSVSQIIVSKAVTNQPPDPEHLPAVIEGIHEALGEYPEKASADSGYFSEANVKFLVSRGIDPYLATGRRKHGEPPPKVRGRPPKNLTPKQKMARKLATKKGEKVYSRRKVIVEPVFGQMKEIRGLRRFLLRGMEKVRTEFSLACIAHNLTKIAKKLREAIERSAEPAKFLVPQAA